MKRLLLVFTLLAVAGLTAWAQEEPIEPSKPDFMAASIETFDYDAFGNAKSVESAYSAGIFGNAIDSFAGVNDWQGLELQNLFAFAGGYAWKKDNTLNSEVFDNRVFQGGFAKTLGQHYIAAYFSGSTVSSSGSWTYPDDKKTGADAIGEARTDLILFYGNPSLGGFRFDLIVPNGEDGSSPNSQLKGDGGSYGEQAAKIKGGHNDSVVTALRWGKDLTLGGKTLKANAALAIQWPDYSYTDNDGTKNEAWGENKPASLAVKVGASYALGGGTLGGDIALVPDFGKTWNNDGKTITEEGRFTLPLNVNYYYAYDSEQFGIGFKPNLFLGLEIDGQKTTGDKTVDKGAIARFQLKPSLDFGIKARIVKPVSVYTGASLTLFDLQTAGKAKGDDGYPQADDWTFNGIAFTSQDGGDLKNSKNGSVLGIGMVVEPVKNLKIGLGLNWLLDHLIKVDLENYTVSLGDFWSSFKPNLATDATGGILNTFFGNVNNLNLTISYQL